jgi:hypothetical protein
MKAITREVPKHLLLTRMIPDVAGYAVSDGLDRAHTANAMGLEGEIGKKKV